MLKSRESQTLPFRVSIVSMEILFTVVILIVSVMLHEMAHGFAALYLGDPTAKYQNRLTLNPLHHIDPVGSILVPIIGFFWGGGLIIGWAKPVPYNPYNFRPNRYFDVAKYGDAFVSIAGPLTNIILAIIFGLFIRFSSPLGEVATIFANPAFINLSVIVTSLNIGLAIFNLIPVPPLDGSKILFSLFPTKWYELRARLENMGLFLIVIVFIVAGTFISPIISLCFRLITGF